VKRVALFVVVTLALCLALHYWCQPVFKPAAAPPQAVENGSVELPPPVDVPLIADSAEAPAETTSDNQVETNRAAVDDDQANLDLPSLATKDLGAALTRAGEVPAAYQRELAFKSVCFGLAERDPAKAVELAQTLHFEEKPGAVVENLVEKWANADLSAALIWADGQPAGEHREQYISRVAFVWSQSAPADAARWVVEQIPPGPSQVEAVVMVVHQWARQDRAAASAWVEIFPEGPLRNHAINELNGSIQE
jgi:hypothetical protein